MQSVGTDGRVFQFLVLQLNTTDLASSEGVKNLVWTDSDQLLYRHFWCRPVIKKKVVVVSLGAWWLQQGPDSWQLGLVWEGGQGNTEHSHCLPFSSVPAVGECSCVYSPPASVPLWALLEHNHFVAKIILVNC